MKTHTLTNGLHGFENTDAYADDSAEQEADRAFDEQVASKRANGSNGAIGANGANGADAETSKAPKQEIIDVESLRQWPNVRAFIRRVGGRMKNPRLAIIEVGEKRHYRKAVCFYRFAADGEITTDDKRYRGEDDKDPNWHRPTDAEQKTIKEDFAAFPPPTYTPHDFASGRSVSRQDDEDKAQLPKFFADMHGSLTPFLSIDGTKLLMVEQRLEFPNGTKAIIPWTKWSDGEWRKQEPEGPLPLYGLEQFRPGVYLRGVCLHEGSKAARHMRRLHRLKSRNTTEAERELNKHPWGQQLVHCTHIGWPGGAPNPDRCDWSALKNAGVDHVTIVCDNDDAGRSVVPKISSIISHYGIVVDALKFDDRFGACFDLADSFDPLKKLWKLTKNKVDGSERRLYIGPSFNDCCVPATWATRLIPAPKNKKGKRGRRSRPLNCGHSSSGNGMWRLKTKNRRSSTEGNSTSGIMKPHSTRFWVAVVTPAATRHL